MIKVEKTVVETVNYTLTLDDNDVGCLLAILTEHFKIEGGDYQEFADVLRIKLWDLYAPE